MIKYMHQVLTLDLEEWYRFGVGTGWVTDRRARVRAYDWIYGPTTQKEISSAATYNIL